MAWSGGSVSFSGGPNTYSVSYTAPTFTFPTGTTNRSTSSTGGPSSVSCGSSASNTYTATYFVTSLGEYVSESTTISGTAPACPVSYPPSWIDSTLAGFQATVAYSDGVSASNMGYSGSYSLIGSLPSGIFLNSSTGAVTGTPTTAGESYSFSIRASNSYGTITASFSGAVATAPTAGKVKVWNGTAWTYGTVSVWNGTSWVAGSAKVWNGSSWVTSA